MASPITIKDIAKKFNCSPSTVSRALNNHPTINEETRKNIQEYASKMDYHKNTLSLGLRYNKSGAVGVIIPTISHFHETAMIEGLQNTLQPQGYFINICVSNESYVLEKNYVEKLLANRAEAIFLSVSEETADSGHYEHLEEILKRKVPLIFIDREYEGVDTNSITIDDYRGAYLATEHLIKMGCKRIAHLKGPQGLTISEQRLAGYKDCLMDYSLHIDENSILATNFYAESALQPTRKLMKMPNPPDAIFAVNDYVALGAMQVIREFSHTINNRIKLIGFDNSPFTAYLYPSMSTVHRSSKKLGEEAGKLFLNRNLNESDNYDKIVLQPQLIIRNSTL